MSLALPASDSPVRALIDMELLASLGDSANVRRLPTYREAVNSSRATLVLDAAVHSVHTLALRADGELWLVRVSRRMQSAQRVWNFGRI